MGKVKGPSSAQEPKRKPRTFSMAQLCSKKFKTHKLTGMAAEVLGEEVPVNVKVFCYGKSAQGKSTFLMRLLKALSEIGKVYYNTIEEGDSFTLQKLAKRLEMAGIDRKKILAGDRHDYDDMIYCLDRNRAAFVVIDSIDYLKLNIHKYDELTKRYPGKAFLFISWEGTSGLPKTQVGKDMLYMADVKIRVNSGIAKLEGRLSANPYYVIIPEKARGSKLAKELKIRIPETHDESRLVPA